MGVCPSDGLTNGLEIHRVVCEAGVIPAQREATMNKRPSRQRGWRQLWAKSS